MTAAAAGFVKPDAEAMVRVDKAAMAAYELIHARTRGRDEQANALWRAVASFYVVEAHREGRPEMAGLLMLEAAERMQAVVAGLNHLLAERGWPS
jgi:hypothetical protein